MITRTRQVITVMALCCAGFVCRVGLGQERDQEGSEAEAETGIEAPAVFDEEVIVRGRSRAALRKQFERAEEAAYARFNEINSDDEFDIHCRREMLTGSLIPRRVCQANFWREAQANSGQETVRALQGSVGANPQVFLGEALYKRQLFAAEMRRLASEDEQFGQALTRLANIKLALEGRGRSKPSPAATSAREVTAGRDALPYGAARMVEVRIGREPWHHELTHRTFAIAHLYGEIQAVEIDCDERTEQLRWEAGMEWTLPDGWESCTLRVDAPPSTSFALYEFE